MQNNRKIIRHFCDNYLSLPAMFLFSILQKDPRLVRQAAEDIYATMVDDIILEVKFGLFSDPV